jgi:hypothetical protein
MPRLPLAATCFQTRLAIGYEKISSFENLIWVCAFAWTCGLQLDHKACLPLGLLSRVRLLYYKIGSVFHG